MSAPSPTTFIGGMTMGIFALLSTARGTVRGCGHRARGRGHGRGLGHEESPYYPHN